MGIRITFIVAFFVLLYGALGFNIYNIQIQKGPDYSALAALQSELSGVLIPGRGSIYFTDKSGARIPAAMNREHPIIYAVPKNIDDPVYTAKILSVISDRDEASLLRALTREGDPFEYITRRASEEDVAFVTKKALAGVYVSSNSARFYPFGRTASHIIGFTSAPGGRVESGRYGLELYYDSILRGIPGSADGDGLVLPIDGGDIHLTIDRNIQARAETILGRLIYDYSADGGTIIVQNPKTGEILAMTSKPNFDPNNFGSFDIGVFLNPAVEAVYEPGSIFKVITLAAGIDAGKITPNTTFVDTGEVTLNRHTIRNWDFKAHGRVTMRRVLEKSINTGSVFMQQAMGADVFYNYLVKFGVKEKKNIDLPGEVTGSLRTLEVDPREINFATASFGQGISVTPISLITAISAIANDGVMMRPYIKKESGPQVVRRVISADSAQQVQDVMVSSVIRAQIPRIRGYNVAGKTGTAQVPDFRRGGYTDNVINTYIGFAPAYDAQFVVMVKLNNPVGAPLAGLTVVPAFRELSEFIINYYGIPPDDVIVSQ